MGGWGWSTAKPQWLSIWGTASLCPVKMVRNGFPNRAPGRSLGPRMPRRSTNSLWGRPFQLSLKSQPQREFLLPLFVFLLFHVPFVLSFANSCRFVAFVGRSCLGLSGSTTATSDHFHQAAPATRRAPASPAAKSSQWASERGLFCLVAAFPLSFGVIDRRRAFPSSPGGERRGNSPCRVWSVRVFLRGPVGCVASDFSGHPLSPLASRPD